MKPINPLDNWIAESLAYRAAAPIRKFINPIFQQPNHPIF
jgi:hypothetical protein